MERAEIWWYRNGSEEGSGVVTSFEVERGQFTIRADVGGGGTALIQSTMDEFNYEWNSEGVWMECKKGGCMPSTILGQQKFLTSLTFRPRDGGQVGNYLKSLAEAGPGPDFETTVASIARYAVGGHIAFGRNGLHRNGVLESITISREGLVSMEYRYDGRSYAAELSFGSATPDEDGFTCHSGECIEVELKGGFWRSYEYVHIYSNANSDIGRLDRALVHLAAFFERPTDPFDKE